MYIPKTLQEENVHNNYLMGLIFSTSWKNLLRKIKFLMGIWIFYIRSHFQIENSPSLLLHVPQCQLLQTRDIIRVSLIILISSKNKNPGTHNIH